MPYGTTTSAQRTFEGADGFHARAVCGHSNWTEADQRLTRPADTTATVANGAIGSTGSALFKFSGFFEGNGAHGVLTGLKLILSAAGIAIPTGIGIRAHLYNADLSATVLSANADKGILRTLLADAPSKLGTVDFTSFAIGGAGSDAIEAYGAPVLSPLHLKAADSARDLYAILTATGAFTPVSGMILALFASRASL